MQLNFDIHALEKEVGEVSTSESFFGKSREKLLIEDILSLHNHVATISDQLASAKLSRQPAENKLVSGQVSDEELQSVKVKYQTHIGDLNIDLYNLKKQYSSHLKVYHEMRDTFDEVKAERDQLAFRISHMKHR